MLMRTIPKGEDPRVDQRSHVFLMAVLTTGARSFPVRVRNLSVHGALLEGTKLPEAQDSVTLRRGSLAMTGKIAWVAGQLCGIHFTGPIQVDEWVDRAGPVGQQRIDAAVADFRHSSSVRRDPAPSSQRAPQEKLSAMGTALLQVCERITELPGMSVELAEELLKIEATAHSLREMSRSNR